MCTYVCMYVCMYIIEQQVLEFFYMQSRAKRTLHDTSSVRFQRFPYIISLLYYNTVCAYVCMSVCINKLNIKKKKDFLFAKSKWWLFLYESVVPNVSSLNNDQHVTVYREHRQTTTKKTNVNKS